MCVVGVCVFGRYYFNFETDESSWTHPCDDLYRQRAREMMDRIDAGEDVGEVPQDQDKDEGAAASPSPAQATHVNTTLGTIAEDIDEISEDFSDHADDDLGDDDDLLASITRRAVRCRHC